MVVGRHVGRPEESLLVTTLSELDPDTIDMGCLVIVGSSQTQLHGTDQVWTRRSVDPSLGGQSS